MGSARLVINRKILYLTYSPISIGGLEKDEKVYYPRQSQLEKTAPMEAIVISRERSVSWLRFHVKLY